MNNNKQLRKIVLFFLIILAVSLVIVQYNYIEDFFWKVLDDINGQVIDLKYGRAIILDNEIPHRHYTDLRWKPSVARIKMFEDKISYFLRNYVDDKGFTKIDDYFRQYVGYYLGNKNIILVAFICKEGATRWTYIDVYSTDTDCFFDIYIDDESQKIVTVDGIHLNNKGLKKIIKYEILFKNP